MDPSSSQSAPKGDIKGKGRQGAQKRKRGKHQPEALAKQADSIAQTTRIPVSLQQAVPPSAEGARPPKSLSRIQDKKLRSHLSRQHLSQRRAAEHAALADEYLNGPAPGEEAGFIVPEGPLERTHRVTQAEIKENVGIEVARKGFELRLDGGAGGVGLGPYRSDYTRNGRHLLLGGRKGHLAAFDWQAGKLLCEIQVKETVRDVKWLHNSSFFAAAQKKYVYIYDQQGVEIHRLKQHIEVQRMEFLPYHFLLATVGNSGHLKYQDTSTGTLVSTHRTGLGSCSTMAQNPLTAVLHLGHANGTVTLWTPNLSTPALKLLAHRGPVTGCAIDAKNGGREMVTSGLDGSLKVWDCRMLGRGPRREWISRRPASDVAYSQRGLLGVGWGAHVSIYDPHAPLGAHGAAPPGPYLTHSLPGAPPVSVNWCPFEDVLGVSHAKGFTSLIVPGAGEPNFDSAEADPYEGRQRRREREVHALLDKIQPDMITLDPETLGQLDTRASRGTNGPAEPATATITPDALPRSTDGRPYARLTRLERLRLDGRADDAAEASDEDGEGEEGGEGQGRSGAVKAGSGEKDKHKMRGRNKSMKRFLRKKRKNVIDPTTLAIKEKLERQRSQRAAERRAARGGGADEGEGTSALDLFTNPRKRTRA